MEHNNTASLVTLDTAGQKAIQTALRNINKNFELRKLEMKIADTSLLPDDFNKKSPDNMILSVALQFEGANPILLASDNGLQLKAKGLGITTISSKDFKKIAIIIEIYSPYRIYIII